MAPPSSFKRFWSLTALLVLVHLLVGQAMTASGAFHKCLHDHAGEHGHECVVTLMLEGGYDTVAPEVTPVQVVADPPVYPSAVSIPVVSVPGHLVGGVLAHAPPRGP